MTVTCIGSIPEEGIEIRRSLAAVLSLVLVVLFIGVDVKNAVDHAEISNNSTDTASSSSQFPVGNTVTADQPNPRSIFSLRDLAIELQEATPLADRIDSDGDTLFDCVESVLGTNHTLNDTDYDGLTDDYEVYNGLDPSEPDTNFDGMPDNLECDAVDQDMDGDGIVNAWDFDNDGDGVNDMADLSPMALTGVRDEFNFEVATDGSPLYLTFQLKPEDPQHLQLYKQYWNWPNGDREGLMRDYNSSLLDVQAVPLLNVTANYIPEQSDLVEYGISAFETYMLVPLIAVRDYGEIVAFKAKVFYPSSSPLSLTLSAKLIWRIVGYSDGDLLAFQGTDVGADKHLIADSEGNLAVTAVAPEDGRFEIVDLDSSASEDYVAIRASNGLYVSVNADGTIIAESETISDQEVITVVRDNPSQLLGDRVVLKDYLDRYISVQTDGGIRAYSATSFDDAERFSLVDLGVYATPTTLVTYDDPFMLTGFTAEENHGTDLGYIYSPHENATLAATLFLSYRYLRNSSVGFADISAELASNGLDVSMTAYSYSHSDLAFISMARETLPLVLDSLPPGVILPVTTVGHDSCRIQDLSDMLDAGYTPEDPAELNLAGLPLRSHKSMKTGFYNTTNRAALSYEETLAQVDYLIPDYNASFIVECMILSWMFGEVLDAQTDVSEYRELAAAIGKVYAWTSLAAGSVTSLVGTVLTGSAFRSVQLVLTNTLGKATTFSKAALLKSKDIVIKQMQGGAKAATKSPVIWDRIGQALLVIAILVESVFSVLQGIAVAEELGGNLGRDVGASYGTIRGIIMILGIIALYYVGSLFAAIELTGAGVVLVAVWCILDYFFGLSDKLAAWLASLVISHARTYSTTPSLLRTDISKDVVDYDNNGLAVGDRINVFASLTSRVASHSMTCRDQSICIPYVTITAPADSGSTTGSTAPGLVSSQSPGYATEELGFWKDQTYESSAWIKLGDAMANFPLMTALNMDYNLRWQYDYRWWCFGWWARSDSGFDRGIQSSVSTEYYDVFPEDLDGFRRWRILEAVDYDHDGIMNHDEAGGMVWRYDYDQDGLGDGFELAMGTDSGNFDGDSDGLSDAWELHYGTDPAVVDSDGDGLRDYRELAGWTVTFNYLGNASLPFSIPVHSDPRVRDSDCDGTDDSMEYWSNLNPNSRDTNGNGVPDEAHPISSTEVTYEKDWGYGLADDTGGLEILTDGDGLVYLLLNDGGYVLGSPDGIASLSKVWIQRLSGDLENVTSGPLFDDLVGDPLGVGYCPDIALDRENGLVFCTNYYVVVGYYTCREQVWISNLNGSQSVGLLQTDLFVDYYLFFNLDFAPSPSRFYGSEWFSETDELAWYEVTILDNETWDCTYWRTIGDYVGEVGYPMDTAYCNLTKHVYIACGDTVVGIDTTNPDDIFTFEGSFTCASGLAVDDNGYVYVTDAAEGHIQVFDSNGELCPYWGDSGSYGLPGNENGNFTNPVDIALDPFGNMYVLENWVEGVRVQKFSLSGMAVSEILPSDEDADGDGLLNHIETDGWEINVTDATGTHFFNVTSESRLNDTDNDGLSDYLEFTLGSNPRELDSDNDGLNDFEEWWMTTHPSEPLPPSSRMLFFTSSAIATPSLTMAAGPSLTNWDSDGDLLGDGTEVSYGSSPIVTDTDAEGLSDLEEFLMGSDADSNDTDQDGMDDSEEIVFNSSLFLPDSDGDLMFDYAEEQVDTDPWNSDCDSDSISDGFEMYFGTDPKSNDTDNDGAGDALELALWLDPLCNDTDSDGILDMAELELGTNPWNNDTDLDGVIDGTDPDSFSTDVLEVIYFCDVGAYNLSLAFASRLADHVDLSFVSIEDLSDSQDSPYIVLLGRPNASGNAVERVIYELLNDTGAVLDRMMVPGAHAMAIRHGVWTPTQTVIIVTEAHELDVYATIAAMRGCEVTILPDYYRMDYSTPSAPTIEHQAYYTIDQIDTVKQTDSTILIAGSVSSSFSIEVHRYNQTTTPHTLSESGGLAAGEYAAGKYVDIEVTGGCLVTEAVILIYYRHSDIDLTGDGLVGQIGDLNETTLCLYWYDSGSDRWIKLSEELDWVISIGLNTTDVSVYGEDYAGYIWVQVERLSLFALAGQVITDNLLPMYYTLAIILVSGLVVGVVAYSFSKRRQHRRPG